MTAEAKPSRQLQTKLWTAPFVLLCIAVSLGYAHQALLTPTVPLYVADKGGSALFAGLVLLAFSVPSFLVRPFLGHLADTWSTVGVLALGLFLLAVGGLLFITPLLAMLFVASIIRGLGWAGLNTGGYTLLADAAPSSRRGEAAGYYTSATSSATVFFPALALWIIDVPGGGFDIVFLFSCVIALTGLPLTHFLSRRLRPDSITAEATVAPATEATAGAPATSGLLDRGVIIALLLNLSSTLPSPAVQAFLPLYARDLGIENIGLFYVIAGITSIVIRPMLGQKSDSIGRGPSVALGLTSILIGLVLIIVAESLPLILLGGMFTSLGSALTGSATTALAMDLANPAKRGKAMATFSISFQVGAGVGAIIAGALADTVGFRGMYVGSIVIVLAGMLLLAANWRSLPKPAVSTEVSK